MPFPAGRGRPARRLAAMVVALVLAGGCTFGTPLASEEAPLQSPWAGAQYAALGDSFTTGAGLGSPQPGPIAQKCRRTLANYPSRLAESFGMELTDRSCGSARSSDVLAARGDRPPQINAVQASTDLVTVRLGANDGDLYDLLLNVCTREALADPEGAPCTVQHSAGVSSTLVETSDNVASVLAEITARAPDATIVLVGYSRLVTTDGSCDSGPYSRGDIAWIDATEQQLDDALAVAAATADVEYVSLRDVSGEASLCAGPGSWINGVNPSANDGVRLHPNRREVAAVTERLREVVQRLEAPGDA